MGKRKVFQSKRFKAGKIETIHNPTPSANCRHQRKTPSIQLQILRTVVVCLIFLRYNGAMEQT